MTRECTRKEGLMKRFFVVTALLSLAALPVSAGYHFVARTTSDGDGGMGSMTVEAWVEGMNAKIVITESENPMMGAGSYLLTRDGGKTLYMVMPEEKTYSVWDLEEMLGQLGGVMEAMGGFMKFDVTDPEVEKLLEEDGESIHGYSTTHYRYRSAYTMQMKVMGMSQKTTFENEQDIWATRELDDEAFGVWLRSGPRKTGHESFDKLMESEFDKLNGFPLKTVQKTVTTGGKKGNQTSTSTTTMEVTTIEEKSVSDDTFEIDPSYEEVPMMVMPGVQPGDSSGDEEQGGMFKRLKKGLGG
jgi:hypothetical protein